MRSAAPKKMPESDGLGPKRAFSPTRRGLIAALAVMSAAAGAKAAHAGAIFPRWAHRRHGDGPKCFLSGTRIRTLNGEVEVDALAVGDLVETVSGEAKPIEWIGRRRFERQGGERWPTEILPVKIARSAFGPLNPHSDLFLSEAHAVYLDGLLIPVRHLINGRSIVRCVDAETIDYFHLELSAHDVIFAEGAATETLQGAANRAFDNRVGEEGVAAVMPLSPPETFAPVLPFNTRTIVRSRLRTALSPWVDRRQPVDIVWERLAERAETQVAA